MNWFYKQIQALKHWTKRRREKEENKKEEKQKQKKKKKKNNNKNKDCEIQWEIKRNSRPKIHQIQKFDTLASWWP